MPQRTYVFAGGGTGGHLFPGIAVAECLVERHPDTRILFLGSDRLIEKTILATTLFDHRPLMTVSAAGTGRRPIKSAVSVWRSVRAAIRLMRELSPTAVIGCGGFASVAPLLAAWRLGVPHLLLEQNVIPGRSTRWLSRLGGTVCLTYPESAKRLPAAARPVVTGNPVRGDLTRHARPPQRENGRTLLVLGGSQGARQINNLMLASVTAYSSQLQNWRIVHQTGSRDEQRIRSGYDAVDVDATVSAFFPDVAKLYRQADFVVSRAGGTTLSELACAGVPAVLLPYPHAAADHQRHNAEIFCSAGAAVLFDERTAGAESAPGFGDMLLSLLSDAGVRSRMSEAMRRLSRPDAALRVVMLLEEMG